PLLLVPPRPPLGAGGLPRAPGPNLAVSAVMGSALLLGADWIAGNAFGDRTLPVGVITGILGGCYLLWLLVSERKAGRL
ncbi:iron chelate uptake ABC transporter family permease subunit, partial [Streptomyces sp. NPDC056049]|uniref:iron chelate uptake ABC transporter family permease subunit n=1 Tax=Streptomyces sp. NPDC056049 TaxID=3345693 RepID=UPI0035D9EFCD